MDQGGANGILAVLALQRRGLWWLKAEAEELTLAALGVRALRRGVAVLGHLQPGPQVVPGPGPPRQHLAEHPADLGNRQPRLIFSPTRGGPAAGTVRPAAPG